MRCGGGELLKISDHNVDNANDRGHLENGREYIFYREIEYVASLDKYPDELRRIRGHNLSTQYFENGDVFR